MYRVNSAGRFAWLKDTTLPVFHTIIYLSRHLYIEVCASGSKSEKISRDPSHSGSANNREITRKSITVNDSLPLSSRIRVLRPIICLNCVIDDIFLFSTISPTVFVSTPAENNSNVVVITGYSESTDVKYSSLLLP